jgi:hypothetical protein
VRLVGGGVLGILAEDQRALRAALERYGARIEDGPES